MNVIMKNGSNTREADIKIIQNGLNHPDPNVRRQAEIAKYRISGESSKIKSMREALVKAHRSGNKAEIADIHDFISRDSRYKNAR